MSRSIDGFLPLRKARAAALVLSLLAVPAAAQDGVVRIRQSLLNNFTQAILPFTVNQKVPVGMNVWAPFVGTVFVKLFDCDARTTVSALTFNITPASISVNGSASGSICGQPFQTSIAAPVTISVNPGDHTLSVRPVGSVTVSPTITLPVIGPVPGPPMSLASSLTVLSVPLEKLGFQVETPYGPRTIVQVTGNHQLSRHSGYIEIRADAHFR